MALLFRVANGSYEECGPAREPLVPSHVLDQLTGQDCLNTLLDYTEKCQEPMGKPARILHLIFGFVQIYDCVVYVLILLSGMVSDEVCVEKPRQECVQFDPVFFYKCSFNFSNPLCLSNILQHKILLRLHKLCQTTQHPVDKCKQCKQVTAIAIINSCGFICIGCFLIFIRFSATEVLWKTNDSIDDTSRSTLRCGRDLFQSY